MLEPGKGHGQVEMNFPRLYDVDKVSVKDRLWGPIAAPTGQKVLTLTPVISPMVCLNHAMKGVGRVPVRLFTQQNNGYLIKVT